jgi:hypothetical protein
MALKQVLDIIELLDRPDVSGAEVAELFADCGLGGMEVNPVDTELGSTVFLKLLLPGTEGRSGGGAAPTMGVIGFLGGIGARPEVVGLVSDGDGAVTALSAGLKLAHMYQLGDRLKGDVLLTTHLSPDAPVRPHEPVPFMGSPVGMEEMCERLVDPRMDAILSIDTTKGNRVINNRGFAISPVVKEGYILRVSEALLSLQEWVTGRRPAVFPITTQDITPYANELYHLNSILQPATVTDVPVVGVAITAETAVPGCATGASHEVDIELAARFVVEAAKAYTAGKAKLYDQEEFDRLVRLYGTMSYLQAPRRVK